MQMISSVLENPVLAVVATENSVLDRPESANTQTETHPPQLSVKPSSLSPNAARKGKHGVTRLEEESLPFILQNQIPPEERADRARQLPSLCDRQNEAPSCSAFLPHRQIESAGTETKTGGSKKKKRNPIETTVRHSVVCQ